jgi:SNF2 family DNA or RNA helicase
MLARVRNRLASISSVEPFSGGSEGNLHLVTVEYSDLNQPRDEQLVWERELFAETIEPYVLPEPANDPPMDSRQFQAMVRAIRWSAHVPYIEPGNQERKSIRNAISSPLFGAIKIDDYQLYPLLKSQRMPRVNLLLADDVGLGKTIEAGLILRELILKRRIRRVLIICPASLRIQWQEEMMNKFSINFDVVDRPQTHKLRKDLGMDANPWRLYSHIITSYHYLKQPDVKEQFMTTCNRQKGSPHLPWDLLIVDEAHNLSPAAFGEDSDLCEMLSHIVPFFEHRLFLTATPHNGHTECFSGLLEMLDPVRFSKTNKFSASERDRIKDVVIRRLKREINAKVTPPPFCERELVKLDLEMDSKERALSDAFQEFRKKLWSSLRSSECPEERACSFAIEVLGKRLLSCPVAFANSWQRYMVGMEEDETVDVSEVRAAERAAKEETGDDRESESRNAHAAKTVGAWLKPFKSRLTAEINTVTSALHALGLKKIEEVESVIPVADSRFDSICNWIDKKLRDSKGNWLPDERLVIFTEYKTTLDYLYCRLCKRYGENDEILMLFGGMDDYGSEDYKYGREDVKKAFNDPDHKVRILIATDAASEGLNLQETARYLLHYDIPWNPARLEQRNGRLDRHGQARDVFIHHFSTNDESDLKFLAYVVSKVNTIREDLGSMGEVFESAFERRFIRNERDSDIRSDLDIAITNSKGRADFPRDNTVSTADITGKEAAEKLQNLKDELDLDPTTLNDTLESALAIKYGLPRLERENGRAKFVQPVPSDWKEYIDSTLRIGTTKGKMGALAGLSFDPNYFVVEKHGKNVFRPSKDTVLMHLGHPVMERALATFSRLRYPGGDRESKATRWLVNHGSIPQDADALILLTVEELAVNQLRENFHHWVRTFQIVIKNGEISAPLPHLPASQLRSDDTSINQSDIEKARHLWIDIEKDIKKFLQKYSKDLTQQMRDVLSSEIIEETDYEKDRYTSRRTQIQNLMREQSIEKLERDIAHLKRERDQGYLIDADRQLDRIDRGIRDKEEEIKRRRTHYEFILEQLKEDSERIVKEILPKRYALQYEVQVFPVAVEIRLPGGAK